MKVEQLLFRNGAFERHPKSEAVNKDHALLILGFGAKELLLQEHLYDRLKTLYPKAEIILSSTAGEIFDEDVYDETVSVLVIEWKKTSFKTTAIHRQHFPNCFEAGRHVFNQLHADDLAYMLVLSDGGVVNGSELVRGIESINKGRIPVTGGLAGDGDRFNFTVVGCNEAPQPGIIAAVGLYGTALEVGHGSYGGWEMFGPEKTVTRSESNKLYDIDGKSALDLYKQYLGKYAVALPGSALLFPLSIRQPDSDVTLVRTILSIDNETQCMVFAGDIPQGSMVRFMKANFDKLIDAATQAADHATASDVKQSPKLALLISCIGRKLILSKRIDEEIEAVRDSLGPEVMLAGFYSYGEISPFKPNVPCELNNQSMTITTFNER